MDDTETLMSYGEQKCHLMDSLTFLADANVEYTVAKGKGAQGVAILMRRCHYFLLCNLRSPGEKFLVLPV